VAQIEHHDEYDDTIPTPDVVVAEEPDPNPEDGSLDDAPPAGYQFAEGAVDEGGNPLNAQGEVLAPKVVD
jgi:hypothetical protein